MDARFQNLLGCHGTPGDEGKSGIFWNPVGRRKGYAAKGRGDYAVTAQALPETAGKPRLLVCAHMDSPGYSVDRLRASSCLHMGQTSFGVTELGTPEFAGRETAGVLKTRRGKFCGTLHNMANEGCDPVLQFEMDEAVAAQADVRHGDRVCFAPQFRRAGHVLESPFLDNRLGCWMLTRLAAEMRGWQAKYQVVLGATSCEEMCGFGANVLAAHVRPDAVVVLDATYESVEQGVWLGGGPVLTLSDGAVLLSLKVRDRVLDLMAHAGVPIQTEVYNFSGTDARAFPKQGLACPVLPVLVPTRGNHSTRETADLRDVEAWRSAVRVIAEQF